MHNIEYVTGNQRITLQLQIHKGQRLNCPDKLQIWKFQENDKDNNQSNRNQWQ